MHHLTGLAVMAVLGMSEAMAAPMTTRAPQWTIQNFRRTCRSDGISCNYSFSINTNDGAAPSRCAYTIVGDPAARASYGNVICGDFKISSSWSDYYGADNGFQTLGVLRGNQLAYPSYSDRDLASQQVVKPDRTFSVYNV